MALDLLLGGPYLQVLIYWKSVSDNWSCTHNYEGAVFHDVDTPTQVSTISAKMRIVFNLVSMNTESTISQLTFLT